MRTLFSIGMLLMLAWLFGTQVIRGASTNTVYTTSFEAGEGYDNGANALLGGQNGWSVDGTAVAGFVQRFSGRGAQAYVGFFGPTDNSETAFKLTRNLNYNPETNHTTIVKFSTYMEIVDSTTTNRDSFRWSVLNSAGHRFFSLDFDNRNQFICYVDENPTNFQATPFSFARETPFTLEITMNFASNLWSAKVGLDTVVSNLPISTNSAVVMDVGQILAEWDFIGDGAGDNALVFDDYTVTAIDGAPSPPRISLLSMLSTGHPLLQVSGEANRTYVLEYTTNFTSWMPLKTNTPSDGTFQHTDDSTNGTSRRFYRARMP